MAAERSNQRSSSTTPRIASPLASGLATPSSSKAPHPPASLTSRAHDVLNPARKPQSLGVARIAGSRERLKRGFSIFKDDLIRRSVSDERVHVLEQEQDGKHIVGKDLPGGAIYRGTAGTESNDTYLEHGREDGLGSNGMDTTTKLQKKLRLSSKGMYVTSVFCHVLWFYERLMLRDGRPLSHYFPFLNWMRQYNWSYLQGDFIAALTMASIYIPMALSLADNLGHVPPINGLYSFVFHPIIYALLGSCPQMVVGPEAAGSLLVGTVIKTSIDRELSGEEDLVMHARIAGVVTGMAGAVIFIAGLMRLGFLEGILSRPFLRGFISGIGFVILADQLIPEMGLSLRAKQMHATHGSSVDKLVFLAKNISHAHGLTCAVAFGSFTIIMVLRYAFLETR